MSLVLSSRSIGSDTYPKAIDFNVSNAFGETAVTSYSKIPMFQAIAVGNGHVGYPNGTGANHTYKFNKVVVDTHGGYDIVNFRYTFPVSGNWLIQFHNIAGHVGPSPNYAPASGACVFYKNGSQLVTGGKYGNNTPTNKVASTFDTYWTMQQTIMILSFVAGDYLDIRSSPDAADSYNSYYAEDINGFHGYYLGAE